MTEQSQGTNLVQEIWKHINIDPILDPYYEVSNCGRVRSLDKPTLNHGHEIILKGHVLAQSKSQGYLTVGLYHQKHYKQVLVHRLVALAFVHNPDPEHFTQVDHIDCDKTNNNASNLEWVTPAVNTDRMYKNHLTSKDRCSVVLTFPDGHEQVFVSAKSCEEETGLSNIAYFLRIQNDPKPGYKVRYLDQNKQVSQTIKKSKCQPVGGNKPIPIRCIETGETFSSIRKCSLAMSGNPDKDAELIRQALRYGTGYVKKYNLTFEYV